ncbi:MAG: dipicolinate synthase subunit DpsA [Clostridia bacterium]|nr:dipicolinate synthase subunit DpsA [Clostridia bacterium]MBR3255744.1 dipicolinate synthase subunit DpsA [Clostridia bacterium]
MDRKIAIIGGDKRMVYLAKMMSEENEVIVYGQNNFKNEHIIQANNLENAVKKSEVIIGPIPFSKDGENVYTEDGEDKIPIKVLMQNAKGKTLIAGAISKEIYDIAQTYDVIVKDLMQSESLAVLNTIATAEGTVEIAIRRTQKIIHGSKVLILGFGRVAKVVADKFAKLSADVTCAARKQEAFAWIEASGYKVANINELGDNLKEYDIIINTPPTLILNRNKLKMIKKDCLVIDLASRPGGVDRDAAKELDINFEWALALPGKVAPLTAAEHIKRTIDLILGTCVNGDGLK